MLSRVSWALAQISCTIIIGHTIWDSVQLLFSYSVFMCNRLTWQLLCHDFPVQFDRRHHLTKRLRLLLLLDRPTRSNARQWTHNIGGNLELYLKYFCMRLNQIEFATYYPRTCVICIILTTHGQTQFNRQKNPHTDVQKMFTITCLQSSSNAYVVHGPYETYSWQHIASRVEIASCSSCRP